ncbi:ribonuclease T [Marinicella sp. S1101]|uniref:ribonuclease T n=1 Tax=Marinicella marina TaxID=2996016 RepID=UPI002260C9C7|nr:ribonuclease T [Marinicella marina]MCX7553822.1 ribonuclease T [Marinicella marina]MDJ1140898.1 ribonuclease T [Marinicella marina]
MPTIKDRFRGFLPVVVDVETGGFNNQTDALLEIAAVIIEMEEDGTLKKGETINAYVTPFEGSNIDPKALEITGIDLNHPLRQSLDENAALGKIFTPIRKAIKATNCTRAILVGHNAHFDLGFVHAAADRAGIKRNPFHPFSCFDTATLSALAYGQTVLARGIDAAGIEWASDQAHSALYDTEKTAELFCKIFNQAKDTGMYTPKIK